MPKLANYIKHIWLVWVAINNKQKQNPQHVFVYQHAVSNTTENCPLPYKPAQPNMVQACHLTNWSLLEPSKACLVRIKSKRATSSYRKVSIKIQFTPPNKVWM